MNTVASLLALLKQHNIADEAQRQALVDRAPEATWIAILQALAAWLAALLVTTAFALIGAMVFDQYFLFGLAFIAASLALFYAYRDSAGKGPFMAHLALGLSISGQILLAFTWLDEHTDSAPNLFANAALALALTIPRTNLLHRSLCLMMAMAFAYFRFFPSAFNLLGMTLTALAVALWLARRYWVLLPQASYVAALAHSATFMGLAIITLSSMGFHTVHFLFLHGEIGDSLSDTLSAVLTWFVTTGWLIRALPKREQAVLALACGVVGVLGTAAPGMLLCLALTLATFHACQRAWFVTSLALAWLFLGLFYYSLHETLLFKSATLAAAGAALLALRWLTQSWQKGAQGETP